METISGKIFRIVWAMLVCVSAGFAANGVNITFNRDGVIQQGDDYNEVFVRGQTTTVNMTGGKVGKLYSRDRSTTNISGGLVTYAQSNDNSTINISGGVVREPVSWDKGSTINVTGGTFWNVKAGSGTFNISGGQIIGMGIYALTLDAVVNIYGYGFEYTIPGSGKYRRLTGYWQNGKPFSIDLQPGSYNTVVLHEVPHDSAPVADAGEDQVVLATLDGMTEVTLDGSASSDYDGDTLTYEWTWTIDGDTYNTKGVNPTIKLPVGKHTIELIVNDGTANSMPDDVVIKVITLTQQIDLLRVEKLNLLAQINIMLEKERKVIDALDESLAGGDYGELLLDDINQARQKVLSAIQNQEQAKDTLQTSIENLEDSLLLLGYEPEI